MGIKGGKGQTIHTVEVHGHEHLADLYGGGRDHKCLYLAPPGSHQNLAAWIQVEAGDVVRIDLNVERSWREFSEDRTLVRA